MFDLFNRKTQPENKVDENGKWKVDQLPVESKEITFSSNTDLEEFVEATPDDLGLWRPEDFGFIPASSARIFFEKKNFELIPKKYNYWLCRKKTKNKKGNTEYLVKFYVKIDPADIPFALIMLTKALE